MEITNDSRTRTRFARNLDLFYIFFRICITKKYYKSRTKALVRALIAHTDDHFKTEHAIRVEF